MKKRKPRKRRTVECDYCGAAVDASDASVFDDYEDVDDLYADSPSLRRMICDSCQADMHAVGEAMNDFPY